MQGTAYNNKGFNFKQLSDIIKLSDIIIFYFRSSELEFNHQNQESHVKLIKEFLNSIYQDVINNNQILLDIKRKEYEKAKNISNG